MRILACLLLLGTGCSLDTPTVVAQAEGPVPVVRSALETRFTGPPDPVLAGECELRVRSATPTPALA